LNVGRPGFALRRNEEQRQHDLFFTRMSERRALFFAWGGGKERRKGFKRMEEGNVAAEIAMAS
jgi:hypothetical protein